ncbi:FHA domain-containing protein [Nocardioides albidus]|uniref:FHA domain-containing protein n=1 Tax=Nocardioides albidus TaxID=1517589 RepID=A0A5C4WIA9_9ACTN|nr:FHA domain-containing protein [Nocardioides albidus]TNM47216.1 FHA domain-containing protein [Nocardioides albidus]
MTTYVPGDLATLVTETGLVVSAPDRLAEVATLLDRRLEAPTVVEVLSRGDLRALPEFAAVLLDGAEARILVRGALVVRVDGFAVDGRDATMWTEASAEVLPGAVVEVAPVGTPPAGPALPLTTGVVRSAGVRWIPVAAPASQPAASQPVASQPVASQPVPSQPVPAPAAPEPPAPEYTVVRGSRPAAPAAPAAAPPAGPDAPTTPPPSVPPSVPPSLPPAPSAPPAGWQPLPSVDPSPEHDGRTIAPAQLQALRAASAQPSAPAPTARPPAPAARPTVALAFSTGRVVAVRRRVLIGRSPRIQQVGGSQNLPALVTVDDPYVSSTHLEVSAEGGRVTVTDMSTNGTLLARQGRIPVPLDRGVATDVALGDVLTLSKGLTATLVPASDEV